MSNVISKLTLDQITVLLSKSLESGNQLGCNFWQYKNIENHKLKIIWYKNVFFSEYKNTKKKKHPEYVFDFFSSSI